MKKKEFKSKFFFELYASELFSWKEMIKKTLSMYINVFLVGMLCI